MSLVPTARAIVPRTIRTHETYLMAKIEIVEIHDLAPNCKRERTGLSVASAYGDDACDKLDIVMICII